MWVIQEMRLYVLDEETAELLTSELKKIICPIFDETSICVDLSRENGNVRFFRTHYFVKPFSDWCVSASVYNPQKCFDILGFIEKHKDMIVAFEADGINEFKG